MRKCLQTIEASLLLFVSGCTASAESDPEAVDIERPGRPLAMLCEGTLETVEIDKSGQLQTSDPFEMPDKEFFVFDTQRKTIFNGKVATDDWYNFCDLQEDCEISSTQSTFQGAMKDGLRVKSISIDRQVGTITYNIRMRSESVSVYASKSIYQCSPADVPIRYREKIGPPRF